MDIFGLPVVAHQMTLEEFMGTAAPVATLHIINDKVIHEGMDLLDMRSAEGVHEASCGLVDPYEDYRVAPYRDGRGCALVSPDEFAMPSIVGRYRDGILLVLPQHRGKGLGAFLVLAAASLKGGTIHPHELTPDGHRAHVGAHRMAVMAAVLSGQAISAHILDEHPALGTSLPGPF